jgi:hypothetical protein
MDPSVAKNPRDARLRQALLDKLQRDVVFVEPGVKGAMPGTEHNAATWIRRQSGLYVRGGFGFRIQESDLDALAEKIVRGLHRIHTGRVLPKGVLIRHSWPPLQNRERVQSALRRPSMRAGGVPPSFQYKFTLAGDHPDGSLWFVLLFQHYLFVSITGPQAGEDASSEPSGLLDA